MEGMAKRARKERLTEEDDEFKRMLNDHERARKPQPSRPKNGPIKHRLSADFFAPLREDLPPTLEFPATYDPPSYIKIPSIADIHGQRFATTNVSWPPVRDALLYQKVLWNNQVPGKSTFNVEAWDKQTKKHLERTEGAPFSFRTLQEPQPTDDPWIYSPEVWKRVFLSNLFGKYWETKVIGGISIPYVATDQQGSLELLSQEGGFNLIFHPPTKKQARVWAQNGMWPHKLKDYDPQDYVIRVSRFDKHAANDRGAFRTAIAAANEVYLSLNAGAVGIGPRIYGATIFDTGWKHKGEAMWGIILMMERLDRDIGAWLGDLKSMPPNESEERRLQIAKVAANMMEMFVRLGKHFTVNFDLKPGNVLISPDDELEVKLIDFEPTLYKVATSQQGTWRAFALVNAILFLSHVRAFFTPEYAHLFVGAIRIPLLQLANKVLLPGDGSEFHDQRNYWIHATRMPMAQKEGFSGNAERDHQGLAQTYVEIVNHYIFDTPEYRKWKHIVNEMTDQYYKNKYEFFPDIDMSTESQQRKLNFLHTPAGTCFVSCVKELVYEDPVKAFQEQVQSKKKMSIRSTRALELIFAVKALCKEEAAQRRNQQQIALCRAEITNVCTNAGRPLYTHFKPMWYNPTADKPNLPLTLQLLRYIVFFDKRIGERGTPSTSLTANLFHVFKDRLASKNLQDVN